MVPGGIWAVLAGAQASRGLSTLWAEAGCALTTALASAAATRTANADARRRRNEDGGAGDETVRVMRMGPPGIRPPRKVWRRPVAWGVTRLNARVRRGLRRGHRLETDRTTIGAMMGPVAAYF